MAISSTLSLQSQATNYDLAAAVTLDDAGTIPLTRALWVCHTTTGTIKVRMSNGDDVTFNFHASGAGVNLLIPIRVTRVWSTGSTAGINVVALY
jgi:hypothetical protein